jgi:hypothetical protein
MCGSASANRSVLRECLERKEEPILGEALFMEYEDVLARPATVARSPLSASERGRLFDAFLSVCEWVGVYFGWRPNLSDEGDNHLIELAVGERIESRLSSILTRNWTFLQAGGL